MSGTHRVLIVTQVLGMLLFALILLILLTYTLDEHRAQSPQVGAVLLLGPPVVPCYPFLGEGSPTKIDYRKKGTLILTSLLEDLV